jgi:diguanylate cyclase (GGDEF)-like protein
MSDIVSGTGLPCLLVADDEPFLEQIVRRIVGESYRVVSASDCATALAATVKEEPAIILLDVYMPDGTGTTLCREIRSKLAGKPLQIILISGHPDDSAIQEGLDSGADDFLKKPVSDLELSLRIKAAYIRYQSQKQLANECEYYKQAVKQEEELSSQLLDRHISLKETLLAVSAVKRTLEIANKRLETVANYDSLTGLLNRTSLIQRMRLEASRSSEESSPLCGIMIDVDFFKNINDSFGHLAGDAVLRNLGKCLRSQLRKDDFAGRYGGEEFFLILTGTDIEQAMNIAQRIRTAVKDLSVQMEGQEPLSITISLGVTLYRLGENISEWIARADAAMYRSKESGRDSINVL